jgi:predicted ester cyclase
MTIALDPIARNAAAVAAYVDSHDPVHLRQDATFVDVASGLRWEGREAVAGMLHWLYGVAFDAHVEDRRFVVGLDGAVLEATFVGRHLAEFAGVPGTGREVRVPLVVIYDLVDGQIVGARIHFGVASFLAQVVGEGSGSPA